MKEIPIEKRFNVYVDQVKDVDRFFLTPREKESGFSLNIHKRSYSIRDIYDCNEYSKLTKENNNRFKKTYDILTEKDQLRLRDPNIRIDKKEGRSSNEMFITQKIEDDDMASILKKNQH